MRFEVRGAVRQSGQDVVRIFEAASEEAVSQQAREAGLLVESVDVLIDMGTFNAPQQRASPATSTSGIPKSGPRALTYRSPSTVTGEVPSYAGLQVAGTILRIYAYLSYVLAALWLAVWVAALASAALSGGGAGPSPFSAATTVVLSLTMWASIFAPMLALLFTGAMAHGAGSACTALRDIARNSWRKVS